jgi:hypothetical protein
MLDKFAKSWQPLTALIMTSIMVARATGVPFPLEPEQVDALIYAAGAVMAVMTGNAAFLANRMATVATAATVAAQTATNTASRMATQSDQLIEATRSVVTAAVSPANSQVIAAAGLAAEAVMKVIEVTKQELK